MANRWKYMGHEIGVSLGFFLNELSNDGNLFSLGLGIDKS